MEPGDLLGCVLVSTKQSVRGIFEIFLNLLRIQASIVGEFGVHILKNHFALLCDLKYSSECRFADQCVASLQSLRATHEWREESHWMWVFVLPNDGLVLTRDLNDSGVCRALVVSECPVVKDEDTPIIQLTRTMLLRHDRRIKMPDDLTRLPRDDHNSGDTSERSQYVPVLEGIDRVDEWPVFPRIMWLKLE